jgi:hypothetical protein
MDLKNERMRTLKSKLNGTMLITDCSMLTDEKGIRTHAYADGHNEAIQKVIKLCALDAVSESAVQDALTTILKVGVRMLTTGISGDMNDWDLPKTTPLKAKRMITAEADKRNEIDRQRAIELKGACDTLAKHFR